MAVCAHMIAIYLSKARGGVLELVYHGPLDGSHVEVGVVGQRFLVSVGSTSVLLIAWLVEIGVWNQYQTLD